MREIKYTKQQIPARISPNPNKFFMGLFDEKQLVGGVSFHREVGEKARHKSNLYGMFIKVTYQNKGLGKLSLATLIDKVKKDYPDVDQIRLSVNSKNRQAMRLYNSVGVKRYGVERNALKYGNRYFDEDLMIFFLR